MSGEGRLATLKVASPKSPLAVISCTFLVSPGSTITTEALLDQADQLILAAVKCLEGEEEVKIVQALLHLRDSISKKDSSRVKVEELQYVQTVVINEVNKFFYERLAGIPSILLYMREIAGDL